MLQYSGNTARCHNARPKLTVLSNKQTALRDRVCVCVCVCALVCFCSTTLRRFNVCMCVCCFITCLCLWFIIKAGWVWLSGASEHRQSLVEGKHFVCASQPFSFFPPARPFDFVFCGFGGETCLPSPRPCPLLREVRVAPLGGLPCFGRVGWGLYAHNRLLEFQSSSLGFGWVPYS